VIKLGSLVPVIDGQDESPFQRPVHPFHPFEGLKIDFRSLSFLQGRPIKMEIFFNEGSRGRAEDFLKRSIRAGDINFPETSLPLPDKVNGKGIDEFIGEKTSSKSPGPTQENLRRDPFGFSFALKKGERGKGIISESRPDFGQEVVEMGVEMRQPGPAMAQKVGSQQSFPRSHFRDGERGGMAEDFPHLIKLTSQESAEDGVNVGAGIIIPSRARPLPGGPVVSFPGMVKGEVHEFDKRDPAPGTDAVHDNLY